MKVSDNLKLEGSVFSYNNDQHKLTKFDCVAGDKISWKRNGSRGSLNAKIIGWSDEKPDYVFIENWYYDWSKPCEGKSRVWIKKRSILRVTPNK